MPSTHRCLSLGTQDNLGPRNYQEASIGPLSYTMHSKWCHMSLLLFVIVVQTALGHPEPFHVSADYPAGCRGGPGPGEESSIINLVESSCIYNMRGVTADGVQKKAAGIILNSNMPGSYGTMYINITITSPPGELSDILVETHGRVNMGFGNESRYFWWNPAASASQGRFSGKKASFHIEAVDFASFPDDKVNIWSSWHNLTGLGSYHGLTLISLEEASSNVPTDSSKFSSRQLIRILKENNHWRFEVAYFLYDASRKYRDYSNSLIYAELFDKVSSHLAS